jgi:membrane associated rhomboid family serine protease
VIPLKDDTPLDRTPIVTVAFIAVNVVAFFWQVSVDGLGQVGRLSAQVGGVVPYEILSLRDVELRDLVPPPLTIVTSMFLHGGVVHLASNMLFLWIFGNNVEDALGRLRFVLFYLVSGTAAAVVQVLASAVSASAGDTRELFVPMVGASGAIAGVLGAYLVLFPQARVTTLFLVVFYIRVAYVPAKFFIGVWFVLQVLGVVLGGAPGVAVFAHVGGFVAGWLLVRAVGRRPGWRARRVVW